MRSKSLMWKGHEINKLYYFDHSQMDRPCLCSNTLICSLKWLIKDFL